jgi:hypothetical protein
LDGFDEALLASIDEILRYRLGDNCTQIIYNYLERNSFPKSEMPNRLDRFVEKLRKLSGDGRGQILGSAPILEEATVENLCTKLGMKLPGRLPVAFSIYIRKLKEPVKLRTVVAFISLFVTLSHSVQCLLGRGILHR